ncbi:MAG: nickel pincer cofactor biosynthesis protein LarC [Deltaproteobacteria bacterium]|nr:nickel pincer cofactor biosynthesis protein LarC [Deltaproteobacteria bacterium]
MLAYFDCFSGISGDMALGAFIDLGVPVGFLNEAVSALPLKGFELTVGSVQQNGIGAKKAHVRVTECGGHRDYAHIRGLIETSPIEKEKKKMSLSIFECIAEAESRIHQCDKESVHFHEVGGVDAIVDIVGTALCVNYLNIHEITCGPVPVGRGFVSTRHGVLPVPAPATIDILKGIPVCGADEEKELVTPTGAAILKGLCTGYGQLPDMIVDRIGYGAGTHQLATRPNLLRIVLGKSDSNAAIGRSTVVVIETTIDDMNPEWYGLLMERLFEDGALDVIWMPVHMKKNRPGTLVQVLCPDYLEDRIARRILNETTTTGLRSHCVRRHLLERELVTVDTRFGAVMVKKIVAPDQTIRRRVAGCRHCGSTSP